ncbi:hypothetical protein SCHPADRAFT_879781 [Schizopora paradoxa]|uniref:Kinetochore protein Sos7 coiled-coil domain-containing protein n=1 Tax=Schizopora paradoxa TaxID=27342 RepID=A0A0H2RHU5_9AGAM|nr:hypothetical protein SCHPADRAFT_879781 [Schizopora paradoxa]
MASTSTALRPSLDNPESNIHIEKANTIVNRFTNAQLHLVSSKSKFEEKINEFNDIDPSSGATARQSPADIAFEVEAQLSFLRKLKFNYLEQNAKDKYIKYIVDDDSSLVTKEENDSLRRSNEEKKARLKEAKDRLAQQYTSVAEQASVVQTKHDRASALTNEVESLTAQILDARLSLSRLRTAHPPNSRMSVSSAHATLEKQTDDMAALDAALSDTHARVEGVKGQVQECAREVERLRVDRAAKEAEVGQMRVYEEDERVMGLYDWYSASLELHRSLFSLQESKLLAENELALTYNVDQRQKRRPCTITVTLLFHPNTRRIADATITSSDPLVSEMNFADLVGSHVQSNDVLGLIRAVMARVRSGE